MIINTVLLFLTFHLCNYVVQSAQPYFPPQITFSVNGGQTVMAIDQINQRAFQTIFMNPPQRQYSFIMQHFPYAIPGSPESKYYVQLTLTSPSNGCMYGTYWTYGGNVYNAFPSHWYHNSSSFTVDNYIKFKYNMIHSNSNSMRNDEDYWYSNEECQVDGGQKFPCEEIYFKKNTDIPLRMVQVLRQGWNVVQRTTKYNIISIGKPDDHLIQIIPKDWAYSCRDVMLGLLYYPQTSKIILDDTSTVEVWLITPPHRIHGNDTVTIEWETSKDSECKDCITWTPERLDFNIANFQQKQTIAITRVKNGGKITLIPVFQGGGFDTVLPVIYPIFIQ